MLKKTNTGYFLFLLLLSNFVFSQGLKTAGSAAGPDPIINADGTTGPKNGSVKLNATSKALNSSSVSLITNPNCYVNYYELSGSSVYESSTGIPNSFTLTSVTIPAAANGLAIGPAFSFPAPNPTFWTTNGGTFWYYNGTSFVNTFHSTSNVSAVNIGGSKNYIYNLVGGTGQVYKYNGTGPSTLIATIPALAGGGPYDLTADDQDNFYYLRAQPPQSLNVYNSNGVLTCSYSVTGLAPAPSGGGFAIVGNTVTATSGSTYYVGLITGTTVNFTTTANIIGPSDCANCYLITGFSSSISATPSSSITCSNPTITLAATTSVSTVTYTWSGPGIVGANNTPSVSVNVPGVYSVSLSASSACPTQTSISTFTVYGAPGLLTPSISASGSLTCTNPNVQLSVTPNSATNTISWSGPGIVGPNNTATIIANAAGIYSVTLTNTLCSGTSTFNLLSGIAPLTLTTTATATQICSPGGAATLTAAGGTAYTWTPAGSILPTTGSVVVASPTATTIYTVNATNGVCTGSASITLSVNPTPTVVVTSVVGPLCPGTPTTLSVTGATSYTWNPGNLVGPSVTVAPVTTTGYTVTGTNGSCSATAMTTIVVIPGPTLSANATPSAVCPGNSSTLTASGALTYTWMPGGANTTSMSVNPASTTVYTVSGSNASGCTGSTAVTLSVAAIPTLSINPASPTICAGNSVTLSANGATNYTWLPGGATTSNITVSPSSSTTYSVSGSNGVCSSNATVLVTVNPNPTVTASANNTLVCSGGGSTLSASGASSYTWMPGNITTATAAVNPTTTTIYTVTGISVGCLDTKTIAINVNNGPTVTVVSTPTTYCSASGGSATLTASGAVTYVWNPGGVLSPSLAISPTVTSTYSVIGTDAMGCISTTTISFSVTPSPTITTITSASAICNGNSATITASGATSYTCNPGAITGNSISVSPASTSIYTVNGVNGNCAATTTVQITVNSTPTVNASASTTLLCSGNSATLSASGASTYTWMPGSAATQTLTVAPASTTNYTVTGISAAGCTANAVISVSVNATPTLTIASTSTALCLGNSTTLAATGAGSYTWSPGATTSASIAITPTVSSGYTVTGVTNGCTATKSITVVVNNPPALTITPNPATVCSGNSTTVTASGASTYTWNPGAINSAAAVVSPTSNTTYTVTGTSAAGCVNSKTVSIVVNPSPAVTAIASPTFICSGNSATLSASGASSYTWNPGAQTGTSIVVSPNTSTTYTVSGSNAFGCTTATTVSLNVGSTPTLTVVASPTALCRGSSATITASGAASYTWFPGGSSTASIVVSPTSTTVYTVSGASGNCNSNKTFTLTVLPRPNTNITAFPPVICKGATSILLATGGVTFTWSPGPANGNTIVASPSVTSSYTVTSTNLAGCSNTAAITLTVVPTPTLTTALSATQACVGSSVSISSSGALTYIILPGAQTGSLVTVTPTASTIYTVTGINQFGCADTKTLSLNVLAVPPVTASSSGTLLCDGGTFTLNAGGANNYTWSPLGITSSSAVTTATSTISSYTVAGESNSCIGTATIGVTVISCSNTIFGVTKAAGTPVFLYDNLYDVTFTITAVNASSLTLNTITLNEDLSAAFPSPATFSVVHQPSVTSQNSSLTINPLFDGVSQISLTSPSTSSLAAGKRDTIVFTVRIKPADFYGPFKNSVIGFADFLNSFTVADSSNDGFAWDPDQDGDPTNNDLVTLITLPYSELFIPNGFSPDNDGRNDLFVIKGLNGRKAKLTVFNRWGSKVYEKTEYDNSWDAFPNVSGLVLGNNKVPPATYYYILEFLDGDKETKTGFVVIQY